jgi:putative hydrolase of the HAD superfamily
MQKHPIAIEPAMPMAPIPTRLKPAGFLKLPLKAFLFDIYGTLFISACGDIGQLAKTSPHVKQISALLHRFQIDESVETVLVRFRNTIYEVHARLKSQGNRYPEVRIDRIWRDVLKLKRLAEARRFALEFEWIVNPVYPMPHLRQMLAAYKRSGRPMGIVSNAQFYTPCLFTRFCGASPVELGFDSDLISYSYRVGQAKPSLGLFEILRNRLQTKGIAAKEVLYVGNDMLNDILPAGKAGFQTALFAGDRRSLRLRETHAECQGLAADLVVTDLLQLIPYSSGTR